MSIQSVKIEIVKKVLDSENQELLNQVLNLMKNEEEDFWNLLSEEEKNEILEGMEELDRGEKYEYEAVMKKYRA